jgi:MFS family permease
MFYGWLIVGVAFVTMAIGVNSRTAFSLLFPPILEEFGWDRGATAGAFSFGFLVSAFLSPVLGRVMDRRGPRFVIELGVGVTAAGLLLAALIREPWHLYVTLGVLVGAGTVCLGYTGQAQYLPNWFVRKRGLAMSIAFSGVGIGSIVLFPLLELVIERAGWRGGCVSLGILVAAVLAPLNVLVRRRPQELGLSPDGDPGSAATANDKPWTSGEWTLGAAMRTAAFWWLALGYACAMFAWYAVQVHQTKYLVEIGFSGGYAAWALGFVSLCAIPGQIALGHLSDRIGRAWVWATGCLGFAICYAALLALRGTPSAMLLWLMVLSQGMLGYGLTSVIGAIPAEIFHGRHYGTIFGMLMGIAIAGGALGPWAAGALHDATASYAPAFWIAIGCCVISAAAVGRTAAR